MLGTCVLILLQEGQDSVEANMQIRAYGIMHQVC